MAIVCLTLALISAALALLLYLAKQDNFRLKIELERERAKIAGGDVLAEKFENLSNRALRLQGEDFAKKQEATLKPFSETLKLLNEAIANAAKEQKQDKGALEAQIKGLLSTTSTLATALTGSNKKGGDLGEQKLKMILSANDMVEGIDYTMQENAKTEDGGNLRPDCVIALPNGQKMIVDSKVNIRNYLDYANEEDKELARAHLDRHIAAMKEQIKNLAGKDYQKYVKDGGFDFVVMFVPIEGAFMAAWLADRTITAAAAKANVYIATPSSILPIIRAIRNLWNIERQNKNTEEIVRLAANLHDKLAGAMDTMQTLGNAIASASNNYNKSVGQLSGHGGALSIADKLRELGVAPQKVIKEPRLIDNA